ncbi:hypothetical protein LguiB_030085 [Lonicera macranthoides]
MPKQPNYYQEDEEEDDRFYESLDRILSSTTSSTSSADQEDPEKDPNSNLGSPSYAPLRSLPIPLFPVGVSGNYDVWISEPSSVEERRTRLLHQMGLCPQPSLSSLKPTVAGVYSGVSEMVSPDRVNSNQQSGEFSFCNSNSSVDSLESVSINLISSLPSNESCNGGQSVNNQDCNSLVKLGGDSGLPNANFVSPNKPPTGKTCRRVEDIRTNSTCSNLDVNCNSLHVLANEGGDGDGELECNVCDPDCNGIVAEMDPLCTIRNLDNGKEFVVNEIRDNGMWNKLKEVSTGRQLTMEEFDTYVGHSPIFQELMRRQNVEEGTKHSVDLNANGNRGGGLKSKKKGSWLRSIKNVASSVKGVQKERRSSDERDTSSEKGGRRSSSATDDSQDVSFHGPERIRVRQYGKTCKELTALYKSQEIQAHNGSIWAIKFSLDGKYLASAGEDCVIHVWQVVESERKDDLFFDKQEEGNLNLMFMDYGSPEPTSVLSTLDSHPEKKRRGRSFSRKSVSFDHIVVPDTVFALSEKPICSFQGHLDDVLDLSWSKSQVS